MKASKLIFVLMVVLLVSFIGSGCGERNSNYYDGGDDTLPQLPEGAASNWTIPVTLWQNSNTTRNITSVPDEDSGKNVMKVVWYTVYRDDNGDPEDEFGQYTISAPLGDSGQYHEYDGLIFDFKTEPAADFNFSIYMVNDSFTYRPYLSKASATPAWINSAPDWVTISIPWDGFEPSPWESGTVYSSLKSWLKDTNGKKIEIRLGGNPRSAANSETTYFRHIGFYKVDPGTSNPGTSKAIWFPK